MDKERELELLAYAKVCFEKCTSPFETIHLVKKKVTVDEWIDLSRKIAECIDGEFEISCGYKIEVYKEAIDKAEKEFAETQEELIGRYG